MIRLLAISAREKRHPEDTWEHEARETRGAAATTGASLIITVTAAVKC